MIDEHDEKTLREARQRVEVVYNYHYGCPEDKQIVHRLETILGKLDYLIREGRERE